ncbi:triose-phosphate isomerase [Brytella acorum]|uniref:Triosephosphate isomerase n=1 Tax=Brytella acorum TaxID=2959299 RepID=A0AA35UW77_9PROT|nr:triose-phosphate isomerase [Brytella acorum]MDF3623903.1 triose-phosphate isomerase [Brytella acorum]CAI9120819.1 triose-phosphate isomerase [Brytella acorum]
MNAHSSETGRRLLIAGNWKMNGLRASSQALARAIVEGAKALPASVELAVFPPFTLTAEIGALLTDSPVRLGAQDCRSEKSGAFTGDIAAPMLADLGVTHVILGHSERRRYHDETDQIISAKAEAALEAGLVPVLCIGETAEERDSGRAYETLSNQIARGVPAGFRGVIAYEPVWAIGTGRTASSDDIAQTTAHIRDSLAAHLQTGDNLPPILYGGSVTARDAASILAIETVGGVLVGGASLKADSFLAIAQGAVEALS